MATLAYFTIPKALETNPAYQSLSVEARYLYARLRDTLKLSIKNNRKDRLGYFVHMTRATIAGILNRSLPTVRKIIAELVRVGLIIDRRLGLTQCNRIYVQPLMGESASDLQPTEKQGFTPDGKRFAPNNRNANNPYQSKYIEPAHSQKKNGNHPKGTVLAQQYKQREYTREALTALYEDI